MGQVRENTPAVTRSVANKTAASRRALTIERCSCRLKTWDGGSLRAQSGQRGRFPLGAQVLIGHVSSLILSRVQRKGQQNISCHRVGIPSVDKQHTVENGRAGAVQRAAVGVDSIGGLEILGGIEIPDHAAVAGIVGTQVAVQRSGEEDSRNQSWRRHLRGTAAVLPRAGGL